MDRDGSGAAKTVHGSRGAPVTQVPFAMPGTRVKQNIL
jgi:hypothetical protein